jgi:antitoxin (DNA-binding transcriptional repressor) of toxin-antitoxin stability system
MTKNSTKTRIAGSAVLTLLLALAILALACTSATAATDPVAQAKADIAKALADAQAQHDVVIADANKLAADLQALAGTKDRATAKATLQADLAKLRADRQAALSVLQADKRQIEQDLAAVRAAKVKPGDLKAVLQQAAQAYRQLQSEVEAALGAAKAAEQGALAGVHK